MEMENGGAGLVIRRVAPRAAVRLWRAATKSLRITLLFFGPQIMYLLFPVIFSGGGVLASGGDLTKMALVVASATVSVAAVWMGVVIWMDGDDNAQRYGAAAWGVLAAAFAVLVALVIADGGDLEEFLDTMFKKLDVLLEFFGG
ncbi:unnamed protein product [Urochloa humidicola]